MIGSDRAAVEALLAPWDGLFGGTPPFDIATPKAIELAYRAAIARKRAEVRAIAADPAPPGFANTIAALEDAGSELRRVQCLFDVFFKTRNTGEMREVERRVAPLAPALEDEIAQDRALWERVRAVFNAGDSAGLSADQRRVTEVVYERLRRRGAGVDPAAGKRLAQINHRIAELSVIFSQNVLADEENRIVQLDGEDDLAGLSEELRQTLAAAAREGGLDGWVVPNRRAVVVPFLTLSLRRDLREKVWRMWVGRGAHPGERDNRPVIAEILRLRGEKARLLGFENYACFAAADRMVGTPEAALDLVTRVWRGVIESTCGRLAELQALAEADETGAALAPWDRRYYAERLRRDRFELDADAVSAHLSLDSMCQAMFWAAGRLYGLEFSEVGGVPVCHPDIRVFAVHRHREPAGLLWLDLYARPGKVSGGWMQEYRAAESFRGRVLPLVSINLNLAEPANGEAALLSWENARVLFHEFGHALHGLCCEARFRSLGSFELNPDVVELPSILNERWLSTPELVERFARHYRTGESMPPDLVRSIEVADRFDPAEGTTATLDYLATAVVDLKLHLAADGREVDPARLEEQVLADLGLPAAVDPLHRAAHLRHAFAGLFEDRYASGYYSYLWAEMLAADIAEVFRRSTAGLYDTEVAGRYLNSILGVGASVPPGAAFRSFMGRDPDPAALMRTLCVAETEGRNRRSRP